MDFWIGQWECACDGDTPRIVVSRQFEGHVLTERFQGLTPQPWSGMSISVYNPTLNLWRQTWVDESGSYWQSVGSLVNGDPSFGTPEPVDLDQTYKRIVFSNITPQTIDWRWESSPDQREWTVNWAIADVRAAPSG